MLRHQRKPHKPRPPPVESTSTLTRTQPLNSGSCHPQIASEDSWKDCAFFKYNLPPEIRIQIWELVLSTEPPSLTMRFKTPNLIKALRVMKKTDLYYESLEVYWRIAPFIFSRFNYRNYNRVVRDAKQVRSIQNLICLFEPGSILYKFYEPSKVFKDSSVRHFGVLVHDGSNRFHPEEMKELKAYIGRCLDNFKQLQSIQIECEEFNEYSPPAVDGILELRDELNEVFGIDGVYVEAECSTTGDSTYPWSVWTWRAQRGKRLERLRDL